MSFSAGEFALMMVRGLGETLYMTLFSTVLSYVLGLPLGILLYITQDGNLKPMRVLNRTLNVAVNILRSVPFLILMIALIPFMRVVVGTSIGPTAAVVALVIAAFPYVGRLVESSLREVDHGVVEAATAMGASTFQIVMRVLLPEALPSLLNGATIATTTILGYSAMAGALGAGGLGDLTIKYGYNRYQYDVMMVAIVILVLVVQFIQLAGDKSAGRSDKR